MLRTLHKFGNDGRYIESITVDFIDGYPLEYWKLPNDQTAIALPKYDKATEVPVWDGSAWRVKKRAFFEPPSGLHEWDEKEERWYLPEQPEPEPSLLDGDVLLKTLIALVDAVENGTAIPLDIKAAVEADRAKVSGDKPTAPSKE